MEKLMKFENSNVQMLEIEGVWYFELYSVGMALGQIKVSKGISYPRKDRIDENVKNAEIKPVVRNGQLLITEEQIYDLMLETRTDKCKAFRKWLTNDVLPTLRKTGEYKLPTNTSKVTAKSYEYFDKTFNGEPVLSTADVEFFTSVCHTTVCWYLRTNLVKGKEYYLIDGEQLRKYKMENPRVSKLSSSLCIVTKEGFVKLCRAYNVKVNVPKCFECKKPDVEIPTKRITSEDKQLMSDIREVAARLIHSTYALDLPLGTVLDEDIYKRYKRDIAIQLKVMGLSSSSI